MELEFERTPQDVIDFNLYHMEHSDVSRRELLTQRVLASLLTAAFVLGLSLWPPARFNALMLGAAVFTGVVIYFIYPVLVRQSTLGRLRKLVREGKNDTLFGRQTVTILSEGILARNQSAESKIQWAAVQQVAESERQLFLFTSAISALIIPKNCFKSEADTQAFLQLVDKYRHSD
jgi:hypothetical protein